MLIRAIVSGLGDRRISSGRSNVGEGGADDVVNGREARLSGSGLLNGAGFDAATAVSGGGGGRE